MLCYLFLFIFTCEPLRHRCYSIQSSALHIQEFSVEICRENLPWLFAARICRRSLPWLFAVAICRGYLPFVFVIKSFFVYVSKSCLYERKPFLYVSKSFLFVRFSLLTVFLFVIAVAFMGHRTCELVFHCICWLKFCNFCMK